MEDDRHRGSFSWHQSLDQATVNIWVPYETIVDDIEVAIDPPNVVAGVRGQMPLLKGKLYENISDKSLWEFEPSDNPRRRTTSTASTLSTQSSYEYVSDPEISSSFAASLDSEQVSDNDDSDFTSPERSHPVSRDEQRLSGTIPAFPQRAFNSYPASPQVQSMESSLSSLDSLRPGRPPKLLTIRLIKEKEKAYYWPRLIGGPVPDSYSPTPSGPFTSDIDVEQQKYNMDPTTLGLLGEEYLKARHDKEEAFEYLVRSWYYLHTPFSALRLVTHYLPPTTILPSPALSSSPSTPPTLPRRGTVEYYVHCIGGTTALAQLFVEAGFAHLDGIATKLLSTDYSPVDSLRESKNPAQAQRIESSTTIWKRDRMSARTYFERARKLAPSMDGTIPYLPEETDLRGVDRPGRAGPYDPFAYERTPYAEAGGEPPERATEQELQMPSIYVEHQSRTIRSDASKEEVKPESTVRMRKRRQQASNSLFDQTGSDEEDSTWYLYLPGLVGAGTALLVVSVVGALSFQSWRKNNN